MENEVLVETLVAGDNYIHIVRVGARLAVVDPGTARPVLEHIEDTGAKLELILLTHDHADHTAGCGELEMVGGVGVGPPGCARLAIADGERIKICGIDFQAIATPGHTRDHLCYYSSSASTLFTGDTIFYGGCGRVFTGDYGDMWRSLQRLRALPGDTRVYCGHDYTADNLAFARSIDPNNERLSQIDPGQSWSTIERECATNPFLRPECDEIRANIGLPTALPVEVFTRLRKLKDAF